MRYDPKSTEADLFPEGWYPATIRSAEDTVSKKNNDMMVVTMKVYNGGASQDLTDYIMAEGARNVTRLRSLCQATGVDFDAGEVDPEAFVNKDIDVRLGISKAKPGDEYGDQNRIYSYAASGTKSDAPPAPPAPKLQADPEDLDSIPF